VCPHSPSCNGSSLVSAGAVTATLRQCQLHAALNDSLEVAPAGIMATWQCSSALHDRLLIIQVCIIML